MHTIRPNLWLIRGVVLAMALVAVMPIGARAAIVTLEDFTAGAAGWDDRDDLMTVAHLNQRLEGSFAQQFFPVDQTDAFRLASGTDFLDSYAGITQISFDFYAANVLPSDLFIRLIDGFNVFSYQLTPTALPGNWQTFTVDLVWSFGWTGGESAFNTALADIDAIEIELTRSGTDAQAYYIDNFQTLNTPLEGGGGEGGGESVIPEPQALSLLAVAAAMIFQMRRRYGRMNQDGVMP